jgi:hypothetical protein
MLHISLEKRKAGLGRHDPDPQHRVGDTKELQKSKQKIKGSLHLNVAGNQVGLDCRSTGRVNAVGWRNGFY